MDRLSVRLEGADFKKLDSLGGKNRTENTRLAIKYAKKWVKKHEKQRTDSKHKAEKAK